MKPANIPASIETLKPEQIAKAKEVAQYLAGADLTKTGPEIPLDQLLELCCTIYQVQSEDIKGRLKPDPKVNLRSAQNAFLWAAVWFSNAYTGEIANMFGCRAGDIYTVARKCFAYLDDFQRGSGKFKYEKQRYTNGCRFLLVVWSCYSLCPRRHDFAAIGRVSQKNVREWANDIANSLQRANESLYRATQLQEQSRLIDEKTRKRLQRSLKRMELDMKPNSELTYDEFFIKHFDLEAPIEKGVYMEPETMQKIQALLTYGRN